MSTPVVSIDLVLAARKSEELSTLAPATLRRDARDYERFLLLAQAHPDEPLAPTRSIDRMWHLHMLHPRAYAEDCAHLFGDVLDHDGGFGSTPDEEPLLLATFKRTASLWQKMFGEPYVGEADAIVKCTRNCVSRCQRACKTSARPG
jgi:hypothetical protein